MTPTSGGPRPGDVVGHYRLDGVVGVGGMGRVHAATDLRLGRRVALKIVLDHATSPEFTARFQREASVLARLDSPHVVAIYDHGEHQGHPYIAMQLAAGGDLGHLLRRRGAMPPSLATRVCAQVADALVAAHAVGVVHRDVKPANVLLRDDRVDRIHVYLSDFGVALTEATGLTTPGAVAGTWNYLAPERTRGEHGSPASDVYAVGCLLHELLTGRPPYAGTDVEVAMEHLSSPVPQLPGSDETTLRVNRILARSMAKEPRERYASATALRDELRDLAAALTGSTPLPGGPPAPPPRRRGRLVAAAVAVVVALAGAGVGVAMAVGGDDDPGSADPTDPTTGPTDPIAPSDPPSEPPAPAPIIRGDLDGDGIGDAGWYDFDTTFVVPSRGDRFARTERRDAGGTVLTGDVDADGRTDLVEVGDSATTLTLTVTTPDGDTVVSAIDVPPEAAQLDRDYLTGDVDGDGRDDVLVASPVRGDTQLTVALSLGDGSFDRPQRWYRGALNPVESAWAVGDFDGDGADDLVLANTDQLADQRPQFQMVRSTGSAFEPVGRPVRIAEEYGESYLGVDEFAAGDVDGDGVPELVGIGSYGFDAIVWRWVTDRRGFSPASVWAVGDVGDSPGGDGLNAMLSDVDGDGRADVVTIGIEGLRVHRSTGSAFTYARAWRVRFEPEDWNDLLDDVALGIY